MNVIKEILGIIPADITKFLLVTTFSLLIGLEQRRRHIHQEMESLFGTDRTFTLIGILGFILYIISPGNLLPFFGGAVIISLLLAVFYYKRIEEKKMFGMTSLIIALITYCLAPLIYTQPAWLVLLMVVVVLVISEVKKKLFEFSKKFDHDEFITLAKFLVIAGVILPLVPEEPISPSIPVSPYKMWLAVVVVSGISYFSYLLKKFVFPKSGILLTGLLGGLYSSTATTVILARKTHETATGVKTIAAIILATSMMYVRILLIALFLNSEIAFHLAPSFLLLILVSAGISIFLIKSAKNESPDSNPPIEGKSNPLEFKTALVFAALFILFALITEYVVITYGGAGVKTLSFIVGVTDVDPFIINLLQTKLEINNHVIVIGIINAVTSNNILKMLSGAWLCTRAVKRKLIISFSILIIGGILTSLFYYF